MLRILGFGPKPVAVCRTASSVSMSRRASKEGCAASSERRVEMAGSEGESTQKRMVRRSRG
jgi:hypothetical protein